jgi:predicted dehydrogenase
VITAIVIGLGERGNVYSDYALLHPERFKIVGAADIDKEKRIYFQKKFQLNSDQIYESWQDILQDKLADVAVIATPDTVHFEPAMQAMKLGYDVLLEKPMAQTLDECVTLDETSKANNCILQIGHVLRYTKFYSLIKEHLRSDIIGDIVHINMSENVSYFHYAHSFVRGNWNNRENSSPMILAKCCHDLDLMHWFTESKPDKISSFGGLNHFNSPRSDLPERCTDGCPIADSCLYYAPRIYEEVLPLLHISLKSDNIINKIIIKLAIKFPWLKLYKPFSKINDYGDWPVSVITKDPSLRGKREALENGPYGRCVYKIKDHNVVDHQQVSILFKNGITGSLIMHGHSSEEGRSIRIDGTRGTIVGEFMLSHQKLYHIDSLTNKKSEILNIKRESGHGGGDIILTGQFIEVVGKKKHNEKYEVQTSVDKSLISHLMAFAADRARLEGSIIDFTDFGT